MGQGCPMTYFGKLLLNSYHFSSTYYSAYTALVLQYKRPCSLWRQKTPEDAPRICFGILKLQTSPGTREHYVSQCSVADLYHEPSFYHFFETESHLCSFYVSDIREVIVTEQVGILTPWDLDSLWQNDIKNV